ncbi:MAG TPA: trypsin-like peptidase domain-containing protein [Longimicrobium sp.]|nr:trypsin-like peptidase domain-containing protein [Longimicrobium sp.]
MLDPVRAKLKLVGMTAGAFAGGVLIASGLDWTTGSHAATLLQATPQPSSSDVRPVQELSQAFISIAESVTPAVVSIETERTPRGGGRGRRGEPQEEEEGLPFNFPFPQQQGPRVPQEASGSGFLISADGYIVTNNHVVADADQIHVILSDNRQLRARMVGRDPLTDIAVIKVEGERFPAARFGRSEGVRIGEWVLAIGNPLDLGTTVTSGIVSAQGRSLNNLIGSAAGANGRWAIEDFIQTDAPINPGNSGGPLVNLRGEVVGVNSAIASPTGLYAGYGFAVPIDLARKVAEDLIRYGRVRRPAVGISVTAVHPEDAEVYRLTRIQGVVAQDFPEGSPARAAGVRQGDVIVAVDGRPVERVGQFQRIIATHQPGETVALDLIRYGDRRRIDVRLIEAPTTPEPGVERPARNEAPQAEASTKLGMGVAVLTPELARRFELDGNATGLVVTEVANYSVAARYNIFVGTRILAVDGTEVRDVAAFRRAADRKGPGDVVSLRVIFPSGENGILNVRLPE